MARKKGEAVASVDPDLPEFLAQSLVRAEEGCFPTFTDEERKICPILHSLLSPQLINDPKHKGQGDPRKVLREPLLMISWDRAGGAWKWAITDKLLNTNWLGTLPTLVGLEASVELCLVERRYTVKKKKVT